MSQSDGNEENAIEIGEQELTPEVFSDTIKDATEISNILHTLAANDDFRDISPEDMQRLQQEIWMFVASSLENKLPGVLERYNRKKFDTDYESGLDSYEFQNYIQALNLGLTAIVELDGRGAFSQVSQEAYDLSTGEYQQWIQSWTREQIQNVRNSIGDMTDIDPQYLEEIKKQDFHFPGGCISKEFWIVLGIEGGSTVEDVVDLVVSIIPSLFRISTYLELRELRENGNHLESAEADIKIAELIYHNPILGLGEISLESLQELWNLMTSGTNESVAIGIISIVGLLAGGSGAVKIGSRVLRNTKKLPSTRIEPTFTKVPSKTILPEPKGDFAISITESQLGNMNFLERMKLAEEAFGREFSSSEKSLLQEIDAMPGTRKVKINTLLDRIKDQTDVLSNTLEIQFLFDTKILRFDIKPTLPPTVWENEFSSGLED